jgi:NAD(P)-dependent dehydrogenase (short-subunit alcohol dehydrogenase family)
VIATMRTPAKEHELARVGNIVLLPLDITDAEQVLRTAAEAIALGDVDVVFNNAGYAMRLQMGDEAFHKAIAQQFFGSPAHP